MLRLQIEWGADEALEAQPLDRLRVPAPVVAPAAQPAAGVPASFGPVVAPPAGTPPAAAPPAAAPLGAFMPAAASVARQPRLPPAEAAAALAGRATTLDALRDGIAAFDGCALRDTASNLVFAAGDPASKTVIVGEPPGREEDSGGHPFAGADGVLLDQMLASIGLSRTRLMLTPLLPWRPPGGRPPSATEVAICLPFLHRLIVLLGPSRLVLFGGTAARALLPPSLTRRRTGAQWLGCQVPGVGEPLPTLVLPSLAEMRKTLPLRQVAWSGIRLLRRAIEPEMT